MTLHRSAAAWLCALALAPSLLFAPGAALAQPGPTNDPSGRAAYDYLRDSLRVVCIDPTTKLPVSCGSTVTGGTFSTAATATAADPTDTEGSTTAPLSVDLTGYLRAKVKIADGANVAQGAIGDAAWSGSGNGSLISIDKSIYAKIEAVRALLAGTLTTNAAATVADGSDQAEGAKADAAWSGSGSGSLIAIEKYVAAKDEAIRALLAGTLTTNAAATIADGSDVAEGAKADAAWDGVSSNPSLIAIAKFIGAKAKIVADAAADTTTASPVGGDVAAGSADAGKPVKTGGKAATAEPTAQTAGNRVDDLTDAYGRKVVVPVLRGQIGTQHTTITASASETTIFTAAGVGVFADPFGIEITNTSASDGKCDIRDATTGTLRRTYAVKAGSTGGFSRDAGSAVPQTTANNNWTATCTSLSSWEITVDVRKTKG